MAKANNQKVVLITGASKGIGLASAEKFARENYLVYATVRNSKNAKDLERLASQYPNNIIIKQLDVTDTEQNIMARVASMEPIDILLNNAGIGLYGAVETATDAQERLIFETNVFGVLKVTKAVLPSMRKRNTGRIITLSSVVGPLPDPSLPAYAASKAAVESYMATLRKNMIEENFNIKVSNIHPGPVATSFELATENGTRFSKEENPYKSIQGRREAWTHFMHSTARPVAEVADIIYKVATEENPNYWNLTEKRVFDQLSRVYKDTLGNNYMVAIAD